MRQIFFIAAFVFFVTSANAQSPANSTPIPLDIENELKQKKAALEPFDQSKVKVDIESLGLDDVDKKSETKTTAQKAEKKPEQKKSKESQEIKITVGTKGETKIEESAKADSEPKLPEEEGILGKIQQLLQKKKSEPVATKATEVKKEEAKTPEEKVDEKKKLQTKKATERYINSVKKHELKKRLEAERKAREKVRKEKARKQYLANREKKLKELREKYLLKSDEQMTNLQLKESDEDYYDDGGKIIPQQKDLNPFLSEEPPAPPILDTYRAPDNIHIPLILTYKEKIDIIFNAIAVGSVSYFNGAYNEIQEPDAKNERGDTLLNVATLLQKYPIMASILAKGANPDIPNSLGYNPMDVAIEMLDIKAIEILANNGANLEYTDKFGRTYLMHAARIGFLPAVELLVSKGVDINAMDEDGFTALSIAYRHQKELIVRFLLKKGAKTWVEKPFEPKKQSLLRDLENRWK